MKTKFSSEESKVLKENDKYVQTCIFCQISQGKAPCHKVWEDKHYLAFLSIFPNTKGLTVVIPKEHQDSYLFDNADQQIQQLMQATKSVATLLVKKLTTVARVGIVFEGFGVNHLHAKLFPLHGTVGSWKQIQHTLNTQYDQYPGYISTHDATRASDEELATIARQLTT